MEMDAARRRVADPLGRDVVGPDLEAVTLRHHRLDTVGRTADSRGQARRREPKIGLFHRQDGVLDEGRVRSGHRRPPVGATAAPVEKVTPHPDTLVRFRRRNRT